MLELIRSSIVGTIRVKKVLWGRLMIGAGSIRIGGIDKKVKRSKSYS